MKLDLQSIKNEKFWNEKNISLPNYHIEKVRYNTINEPIWVHFGVGNIFRIFIGGICDKLISKGYIDKGIVCVEAFDFEVIDKIYKPYDNLVLSVMLNSRGEINKSVLGSLCEALKTNDDFERLKNIFKCDKLQIVSFTITEKGYALKNSKCEYLPYIKEDIKNGPEKALSVMAKVTALLYERYLYSKEPVALVSMDNCSHNGEKLKSAICDIAKNWLELGFVDKAFIDYISDDKKVSYPLTMIDKITPRPSEKVYSELKDLGLEDMDIIITDKNTYIAPFVNAEVAQYLVIEDKFPNGRPPFEKVGVYMTDRDTVNKVEKMKVTTCLNPLHTALAVYGCLLGYKLISDEMKDENLKALVENIGYKEGLPVVIDPEIISPSEFIDEVINERLTNPNIPDSPFRIATDTSQKVGIRYGETIKSYVKKYGDASNLTFIPLTIAGWCRYLLGIDDKGNEFEISPDPMLDTLKDKLKNIILGDKSSYNGELKDILSNSNIFGIDLYDCGIGNKIEEMFLELIEGRGAVRKTLEKYLQKN
ncbi:MAG: mannitol dehydrogenase family protein [Lachnospirales bacterium]